MFGERGRLFPDIGGTGDSPPGDDRWRREAWREAQHSLRHPPSRAITLSHDIFSPHCNGILALGIKNVDQRLTCPVTVLNAILAHQLPQQSGHLRSALSPLNCASPAGIPMPSPRHDLLRMCYSTLAFLSTWCE
jgi:hypothetical protein